MSLHSDNILLIKVTTKKSTGFRCFSFAQKEETHGNQNQQRNTQLQGDCLLRPNGTATCLLAAGGGYGGGAVLRPAGRIRPRDAGLAVHRGCCTYGGGRLLSLQRPDAGAIPVGVVQDQLPAGRSAAVAQRELSIRSLGEGGQEVRKLFKGRSTERDAFRIPRSVQQSIPIKRIYKDGVFQVSGRFSKTWRFLMSITP